MNELRRGAIVVASPAILSASEAALPPPRSSGSSSSYYNRPQQQQQQPPEPIFFYSPLIMGDPSGGGSGSGGSMSNGGTLPSMLAANMTHNETDGSFDSLALDRKLNQVEETLMISIFSAVIILGFFGNILVVWTVLVNKHMRSSNNLFILNLAISDLTLCVFSIPFNVYKVLRHTWAFGEFLCKFAPFFQATNVFVSTMSITAIALDRYISIVCAMRIRQTGNIFSSYGSIACLVFIWAFAFLLSSPLFLFNIYKPLLLNYDYSSKDLVIAPPIDLKSPSSSPSSSLTNATSVSVLGGGDHSTNLTAYALGLHASYDTTSINNGAGGTGGGSSADSILLDEDLMAQINVAHCIENSPFHQSRLIYSYASLVIQYTLPIIIVGVAYGSIWWKLKKQRDKLKSHHQHQPANNNTTTSNQRNDTKYTPVMMTTTTTAANNGAMKTTVVGPGGGVGDETPQRNVANTNTNTNTNANVNKNNAAAASAKSRRLKMNLLLAFIAIIFAGSWLPLNIFNILSDSNVGMMRVGHSYYLVNAICILFAMSSAVSNPFLYGFLNENFKREYAMLFRNCYIKLKSCCSCSRANLASTNGPGVGGATPNASPRKGLGAAEGGSLRNKTTPAATTTATSTTTRCNELKDMSHNSNKKKNVNKRGSKSSSTTSTCKETKSLLNNTNKSNNQKHHHNYLQNPKVVIINEESLPEPPPNDQKILIDHTINNNNIIMMANTSDI